MSKTARFNGFVVKHSAYDQTLSNYNFDKDAESMGTKALTTRQPPRIHAMIEMMSSYLTGTSKAEIIYECILAGFSDFEKSITSINPALSEVIDEFCPQGTPSSEEEYNETVVRVTAFDQAFTEVFSSYINSNASHSVEDGEKS